MIPGQACRAPRRSCPDRSGSTIQSRLGFVSNTGRAIQHTGLQVSDEPRSGDNLCGGSNRELQLPTTSHARIKHKLSSTQKPNEFTSIADRSGKMVVEDEGWIRAIRNASERVEGSAISQIASRLVTRNQTVTSRLTARRRAPLDIKALVFRFSALQQFAVEPGFTAILVHQRPYARWHLVSSPPCTNKASATCGSTPEHVYGILERKYTARSQSPKARQI